MPVDEELCTWIVTTAGDTAEATACQSGAESAEATDATVPPLAEAADESWVESGRSTNHRPPAVTSAVTSIEATRASHPGPFLTTAAPVTGAYSGAPVTGAYSGAPCCKGIWPTGWGKSWGPSPPGASCP